MTNANALQFNTTQQTKTNQNKTHYKIKRPNHNQQHTNQSRLKIFKTNKKILHCNGNNINCKCDLCYIIARKL